ncbi:MAG: hypothetical protein ABIL67_01235 [candidate division WOR-3 bacterium]
MPLIYWSLVGMEVSALVFITFFALYLYVKDKTTLIPFLMALGVLIRMDYALVVLVFFLLVGWKERLKILSAVFIMLLGMTVFRVLYYGDIFPNTYYLKATGLDIYTYLRGIYVALKHILIYNPFLYGLAFYWAFKIRDKLSKVFIFAFIVLVLYVVKVGGDVWESSFQSNRFFLNIFPFTVLLTSFTLSEITRKLKIILVILSLMGIHPSRIRVFLRPYEEFHISYNPRYLWRIYKIGEITRDGAKIAVAAAGIIPYYLENRYFIDLLGKNDRYIAKLKPKTGNMKVSLVKKFKYFPPGHNKWDYSYSIGKLKPDVIVNVWVLDKIDSSEFYPYVRDYIYIFPYGLLLKTPQRLYGKR